MTLTGFLCVFLDHCHVSPPTSLYPVVPGNARFITDKEVVLGNYWFPKKVGEAPAGQEGELMQILTEINVSLFF